MKIILKLFLPIVTTEIIKLKGTLATWLTLIYPLGTVFLVSLLWISTRNNKNITTDQFISNMSNTAAFFLPFFIVLMISVACNTEHKSAMMKHILSLPVPRPLIYLGKFTGIMVFIAIAFVLILIFTYSSLLLCGILFPGMGIGNSFNHLMLFRGLLSAFIGAAFIYSFQYWLGMRLRNLTLPVAIGSALIILPIAVMIIMGITGLITNKDNFTKIITYNPYSYPYSAAFNFVKSTDVKIFSTTSLVFITLSVIGLVLGVIEFNRRDAT